MTNACIVHGDKDSIEHTFIECPFTESLAKKVIQRFNKANCCQISPTTEELLFGIIPSFKETNLIYKFNYTTLSMRHVMTYIQTKSIVRAFTCINLSISYLSSTIGKISIKAKYLSSINEKTPSEIVIAAIL